MNKCIDCQKEISRYAKRCKECANKIIHLKLKKRIKKNCKLCKIEYEVIPYRKNSKFCSRKCMHIYWKKYKIFAAINNPNYRRPEGTKRNDKSGYVLIKHRNNWIAEHILKITKYLKRKLKKTELIHHINLIKHDNNIKNLYLCSKKSIHNNLHKQLNNIISILIQKNVIKFNKKKGTYFLDENRI